MTGPKPPNRRRWQLRLRTMIQLVVLAALGLNIARDRRQITHLEREFTRLRPYYSRPLVVTDPSRAVAQVIMQGMNDGERWQVYLPSDGRYRLCLATRVGTKHEDMPSSYRSAPIEPGRHILGFDGQPIGPHWRVFATWNQADRLMVDEAGGWYDPSGWSGLQPGQSKLPPGERIPLTYRRYGAAKYGPSRPQASGPAPEVAGLKFWIESEPDGPATAGAKSGRSTTSPAAQSPPGR